MTCWIAADPAYYALFDEASGSYSADSGLVTIAPVKHWSSAWAWWGARNPFLKGSTPTFQIAKSSHFNLVAGEWLCAWATSQITDAWNAFDNVNIGATYITFSNNAAFPAGRIYIAALPMYPFARVQQMVAKWRANTNVADTASGSAGIVANTTSRDAGDGSGRTVPALPIYGLKITDPASGNSKNKAILSAYNHPSETPGPFQLEGAVSYLLSGAANAETLLDWFEFYVYPCLNPQGVWAGYFRSSPQTPASDNNRLWSTTGQNEAVDALKTAMAADTGGAIAVGLDYHSEMSTATVFGSVQPGDTTGLYAYYRTEMRVLDGVWDFVQSDITESLRYWWKTTLGGGLTISQEQGGTTARTVASWKAYGANSMKALYEMLVDGRFTYHP